MRALSTSVGGENDCSRALTRSRKKHTPTTTTTIKKKRTPTSTISNQKHEWLTSTSSRAPTRPASPVLSCTHHDLSSRAGPEPPSSLPALLQVRRVWLLLVVQRAGRASIHVDPRSQGSVAVSLLAVLAALQGRLLETAGGV